MAGMRPWRRGHTPRGDCGCWTRPARRSGAVSTPRSSPSRPPPREPRCRRSPSGPTNSCRELRFQHGLLQLLIGACSINFVVPPRCALEPGGGRRVRRKGIVSSGGQTAGYSQAGSAPAPPPGRFQRSANSALIEAGTPPVPRVATPISAGDWHCRRRWRPGCGFVRLRFTPA